jgi:DNA uptake protein ComE-like DNA-binding protein
MMRTYKAFYHGKTVTVIAETSYAAQQEAAKFFKVKPQKTYEVAVVLADVPVDCASL